MATIDVKDAADVTVPVEKPLPPGRAAAAASKPFVLSTEDKAVVDAIAAALAGTLAVSLASVPSHAVTNTGTFAVQPGALAAGANNIGDVDVLTLPALPAGTNNIGDVDVLTAPGTYAEDAAHASGEFGALVLAVRRDANTTLVDTDGDRAPVQVDANGGLKVSIIAGAGSGGTAATDDGAFTAASGSGTPLMGFVTADAVDSGDVGVVAMTTARALHVAVQTLPALPAGANNIGDVDVLSLPALPAGTNAIGKLAANTGVDIGDVDVTSLVAAQLPTALGQGTMAQSMTVVVASNQSTIPVSTASLPLPTGAATETSVAAAATSLAILDDWDETDRAKANIIVGQAGVAAGAGAVGVTVQRVTLASDDPAVVALQIMDDAYDATLDGVRTLSGGPEYETVAASQTTQTLGATGATGDYLEGLVCVVAAAATSTVSIKDGADAAINVLPNAVGGGIGTYYISLGLKSRTGAWQVTTGAGVSVIATGNFT